MEESYSAVVPAKKDKRLTKIREQFRQEERNKLPSQGDRLVLLK